MLRFIYAGQAAPFRNQLGWHLYSFGVTSARDEQCENGRKWHGIDKNPAMLLCSYIPHGGCVITSHL